jgi:glycosyltransferase involved in cell wall biosynthesis
MAKKLGIPTVITLHTKFDLDFKRFTKSRFILRRLMRYIMGTFESADEVWTVNNATVETLRGYGYKGDVRVMRNGTDMTYPDNADTLAERVRTRYGLRADEPVLLFVGRIVMYKNLALICDALQAAKSGGFKFKMLVVGGGEDLNAFQKKAEDCGLKEEFIFAGKVTDREELSGYYLASDLFLFPSTFDTSSLVPVEAAAHKLPVLLIRGCSTAEGVTDGEDAFLSEENPADFAAKIQDAFSDRARLIRVGETARARIYRTWADAAAEALQHYTRIISDSRERTR